MTIDDDRPIQAEAYEAALKKLASLHPDAPNQSRVIDAVMAAVLDLAAAGQTDVEALARYGAHKGLDAYLYGMATPRKPRPSEET